LKEDLMRAMGKMAKFEKPNNLIEMTVTLEELQIELMEDPRGTFFENGSVQLTPIMRDLLNILSAEAGKVPNPISIEGHADSKPYSNSKVHGNLE
jgi:chemotaxis protein MotB